MSRREYKPLKREEFHDTPDSKPERTQVENAHFSSHEPLTNGKVFKDEEDPAPDSRSFTQELKRPTRISSGFEREDYRQMEFESSIEPKLRSQPLHRHVRIFFRALPSKTYRFSMILTLSITAFILGCTVRPLLYPTSGPLLRTKTASLRNSGDCEATSYWNGWSSISHSFVFGDSWSSTSFDPSSLQPTPAEPLGNPPFPGITSSNSTNWIGYLTTTYNKSTILTYNLAVGGTTLDNTLLSAFPYSVTESIYQRFMPAYAEALRPPWLSSSTLFILFIGINDVIKLQATTGPAFVTLDRKLEAMHLKLLSSLYAAGARNFLLLNVPPLERLWQPPWVGQETRDKYKIDVKSYNEHVKSAAERLKGSFEEANVWLFDTNELFGRAMENPANFKELAHVSNTTHFCLAYADGTPTPDYFDPECGVPVNEYFWLNPLHPTYPPHNLLAAHVVRDLERGPNVC